LRGRRDKKMSAFFFLKKGKLTALSSAAGANHGKKTYTMTEKTALPIHLALK